VIRYLLLRYSRLSSREQFIGGVFSKVPAHISYHEILLERLWNGVDLLGLMFHLGVRLQSFLSQFRLFSLLSVDVGFILCHLCFRVSQHTLQVRMLGHVYSHVALRILRLNSGEPPVSLFQKTNRPKRVRVVGGIVIFAVLPEQPVSLTNERLRLLNNITFSFPWIFEREC